MKMEIELSDTAAAVIAEMAKRGQVQPAVIARLSVETSLSQVIDRSIAVDGDSVFLRDALDADRACQQSWEEVLKPGSYGPLLRKPGAEIQREAPSDPDLLKIKLLNGYMVWRLNGEFRKILRPLAREFGVCAKEFLHLYTTGDLPNQPTHETRLDESDVPAGFSVNLGNDERALERIKRAAEFSGHSIEAMAWKQIGGFVDCCEDDMIFHPVTGKPIFDEVEFGKFRVSSHYWPIAA